MKELYSWIIGIIAVIGLVIWLFVYTINKNDIRNTDNYDVIEFTHNNHDYIFIDVGMGQGRMGGLEHNPDCRFCNDKNK